MTLNDRLVEIQSDYCFRQNDCFNSYDEFSAKLELHSSKDLVYYWRRDSRTIEGAALKTSRLIATALRYYSVRYSCIFGGQKFEPKSRGMKKLKQSIRNDCPAYIALRASKCGQQLVVISVSNIHNHEISLEVTKNLAHTKKLSSDMKQEVSMLLTHSVDKKLIREYVRLKEGKELNSKDLCNLVASLRKNVHFRDSSPDSSKSIELTANLINYININRGSSPMQELSVLDLVEPESTRESVTSEMVEERLIDDFDNDETQSDDRSGDNHEECVIEILDASQFEKDDSPLQTLQSSPRKRRFKYRWRSASCVAYCPNYRLVRAQLEVLRARRDKLREETELLRLKKRKLQLEIERMNKTRDV